MTVRHHVENLIRRGNIFYWRPRIPRSFLLCPADSRLSLSLQASDHRKAQMMARRLNTLLADLKLGSMAGTTTKDQLARLCAAERDQMMDHLEGIAFAARRRGRPHDITDVEMDLENGWAYRLLENFGPHTLLTLDDGCPGRALLDRNGIPDAHIANIKADYASARSQFLHKGHENRLRAVMKEFEIPDSALN